MTSLAELIETFRKGAVSRDAFFAQIELALATGQTDCSRLREVLDQTQTKDPLPDEIYSEAIRRIERFSGTSAQAVLGDETRAQTAPVALGAPHAPSSDTSGDPLEAGAERTKGIGDTLNGRFVLEACLGIGGMGTVYKALDLRKLEASDRKPYIAIKVLNVQFRGQPNSLIALQREARKAQTLAHRNIVTVYDFDRDGPLVYLTMEYLQGSPLSKMLRAPGFTGLTQDKALPIIAGMGHALAYAHERGFVHCDFKPANVFLTDGGEVKVIDFGIARVLRRPDEDGDVTVFDPAMLGGITPAYASPEMFEHREPDPRDDIYALGCVTYELLTGRHPFNRASATQARGEHREPERVAGLTRRQWQTLRASLSFERATRTPSVEAFLDGMGAHALRKASATPPPARTKRLDGTDKPERRFDRNGPIVAAAWTGGAVAVIAALFYGVHAWLGAHSRAAQAPVATVATAVPQPSVVSSEAAPPPALSLAAVKPVLGALPCSALRAVVQGDALRVSGYLGRWVGLARLRDALSGVPGVKSLSLDITQFDDRYCDMVTALAPYWVSTHEAGSPAAGTSIATKAPNAWLTEGSPLVLDVKTPDYDAYVNVDYYVLDGSVVHLVPSRREPDNQAPPNYAATIGSMGEWVIGKPFGTEIVTLVITPAPLFRTLRPESESHAEYLKAMEERLKQVAAQYGAARIAVDFVQITTRGKG
ncbi:protein kinase domain-containing protein [Trinickia sp.]|uniref:serine/threonine protein kinase n=1 Tax=Trinickia sp. TaxID=2571163 RepID=UPI003F7D9C19